MERTPSIHLLGLYFKSSQVVIMATVLHESTEELKGLFLLLPSPTLNQSVELNPHDDQMLSTNYNHVLMVGVMSLIRYEFFLDF
jgi:hypothetical protein